ncbi:MAG: GAF domain-containing protein [Chloroflexi bacterium]|nr:GAF domain-containing protein [Chloroflexota bacterium]
MADYAASAVFQQEAYKKASPMSQPWATLHRLASDPFFWLIAAATSVHILLHYAAYVAALRPLVRGIPYFNLHAAHEVEFIALIAFTAYRYRWKGGLTMVCLTLVASIPFVMTPYVFGRAPQPNEIRDRVIEVAVTLAMGGFITFLIEAMIAQKERALHAWQERQANVNRLITLNSVSQVIERDLDLKSTVERILQALASNVEGQAFFLYLYDDASRLFTLAGRRWAGTEEVPNVNKIPLDEPLFRSLAQSIAVFRGPGLPPSLNVIGGMVSMAGLGIRAVVPLRFVGSLLGIVVVCYDRKTLPPEDMALLSSLGHIMALAINNARTLNFVSQRSPLQTLSDRAATTVA